LILPKGIDFERVTLTMVELDREFDALEDPALQVGANTDDSLDMDTADSGLQMTASDTDNFAGIVSVPADTDIESDVQAEGAEQAPAATGAWEEAIAADDAEAAQAQAAQTQIQEDQDMSDNEYAHEPEFAAMGAGEDIDAIGAPSDDNVDQVDAETFDAVDEVADEPEDVHDAADVAATSDIAAGGVGAGLTVKNQDKKLKKAQQKALKKKSAAKTKGKKRRSRKGVIWAIVAAVLALVVVGVFFAVQNMGIPVETAQVEAGDVAVTVFATGTLTAGDSRDVYPETQGLIKEVLVRDGDIVEEGDVLARIDSAANQAQLSQAQAALAQAHAALAQAESGNVAAGAGISQARAGLDGARAAQDGARSAERSAAESLREARNAYNSVMEEFEEEFALLDSGMWFDDNGALEPITPAEAAMIRSMLEDEIEYVQLELQAVVRQAEIATDQAGAGVAQASAGVAQAQAAVDQARATSPEAAVTAARAGVAAAEDGVALAEAAVEATVIRAPIDGKVLIAPTPTAQAAAGTGVIPTGGMELTPGFAVGLGIPLFTVIDDSALSFVAEIDEIDIRMLEVGQTAQISLSSFAAQEFSATVNRISNTAKPTITGGTVFDVELIFDDTPYGARIGMRGDAVIEIETQTNALTIPIDAWFSEAGEDFVWRITDENMLEKVPVILGASTEFVVEILAGLDDGDVVALASNIPFAEDIRVTPLP